MNVEAHSSQYICLWRLGNGDVDLEPRFPCANCYWKPMGQEKQGPVRDKDYPGAIPLPSCARFLSATRASYHASTRSRHTPELALRDAVSRLPG